MDAVTHVLPVSPPSSGEQRLPDANPLFRRQIERIVGGNVVGVIPLIEIAHDRDARLRRRMRIGDQPLEEVVLAVVAAPDLCPAEIEALVSGQTRSEEHTSELQSLMRISYAVFCLNKKTSSQSTYNHTLLT